MHPILYLDLYHQQLAERLRAASHQRLIAQLVRERGRSRLLEHPIGNLLVRLGLWLRVKLTSRFV